MSPLFALLRVSNNPGRRTVGTRATPEPNPKTSCTHKMNHAYDKFALGKKKETMKISQN